MSGKEESKRSPKRGRFQPRPFSATVREKVARSISTGEDRDVDAEELAQQQGIRPQSTLKRLEEEERQQQRRGRNVRAGVRLSVIGFVVLGLFTMMVFRLWSLQVLNSSSARQSVAATTTRTVPVTPPRGMIIARGGQVVVGDKVEPVVTLDRQVAADDPQVVRRLAVVLGVSVRQIHADILDQQNSIYEPVPVEVAAPQRVTLYLAEHRALFPGVRVSDTAEPLYRYGRLAPQVLGYVSDISASQLKTLKRYGYTQGDQVGQAGIEAQYERYLHGTEGLRRIQVNASGLPAGTEGITAAKPGDNVVLNIDLGLQEQAQLQLDKQIASLRSQGLPASSGAVVVEDPRNGAVLAMASAPSYDPSWWVGGMSLSHYRQLTSVSSNYPLLNRATQGLYTPGSTFKVNTATAALDDHLYLPTYGTTLTPSTLINDPGSFTIPNCSAGAGCVFQDDDSSGCGSCNLVTAIAMSDDVFFYTLGYWFYAQPRAYGIDPIQRIAADYGVGQPTGIDLPGAYTGQVDGPRLRQRQHREAPKAYPYTYYGPGDAINTAFGQGETVLTPLQLANEYATFANGGTRYAPEVAAAVVSPDGKVIRRVRPRVMAHVPLPPSTRQPMLQGFTEEVTDPIGTAFGTAQLTNYPYAKLPIAGKTGTSQVSANANTQPDSLYVAFGPVAHPRYVIATIIPNAGYGATASAPVVFRLFEYLIRHPVGPLDLKPPAAAG